MVIFFLDCLEEIRVLLPHEFTFRNIIKDHLAKLLHSKNLYWRKRYTVNKIKFGDECTKFFHAIGTISYRKKTIPQLQNDSGVLVLDHEGKAALLLIAYRNRIGISMNPQMRFDLDRLIQVNMDFSSLVLPIRKDEIERIVKVIPPDKALGPDGFNAYFFKNCWPIIIESFYELCEDFFNGTLDLESIKCSYITLVPKINNPKIVNDLRPIYLLSRSIASFLQKFLLKDNKL